MKVLVISSDSELKNRIAMCLKPSRAEVVTAAGGFEGCHLLEQEKFGFVLIVDDFQDMLFYEMVLLIRNTKNKKVLPIILLSEKEKDQRTDLEDLKESGLNGFLKIGKSFQGDLLDEMGKFSKFFKAV